MMDPPQSHGPPHGIRVETIEDGLVISRSWRNAASWGVVPVFLMFCGLIVALFRATHLMSPDHPARWFPAGFAVVGGIFLYGVSFRLFNRTRIRITPQVVRVDHGPLPWKSGVTLPVADLRTLRVMPVAMSYSSRKALHWHLLARRTDGRETPLIVHDVNREQACYIAREIARITGSTVEIEEAAIE